MGRFSRIVPLGLLSILFVGSIVTVEGKPRPDSIFGSSQSVIPGLDEFKTNMNLNKIGDVITGKRDMSVVVTRDGKIEVNAGFTDEEKVIYGSIGIGSLLLLVCCCVCCCRMCCGGQKPQTTNVVYQQLPTPQYQPSRSNPAPTHSVPISTVSGDATKY